MLGTTKIPGVKFLACRMFELGGWLEAIFGHVHQRWPGSRNSVNVGVDAWDFMPVTLTDIGRRARELPVNLHWADVECRVKLG